MRLEIAPNVEFIGPKLTRDQVSVNSISKNSGGQTDTVGRGDGVAGWEDSRFPSARFGRGGEAPEGGEARQSGLWRLHVLRATKQWIG